MGVAMSAILRTFLLSKISLLTGFVAELKATTSRTTSMNCQSTIDINVSGENAHTIVSNSANHHVLRQLRFSSCSNPNNERTNHGPTTIRMTVPKRPELMAESVTGEKA